MLQNETHVWKLKVESVTGVHNIGVPHREYVDTFWPSTKAGCHENRAIDESTAVDGNSNVV